MPYAQELGFELRRNSRALPLAFLFVHDITILHESESIDNSALNYFLFQNTVVC